MSYLSLSSILTLRNSSPFHGGWIEANQRVFFSLSKMSECSEFGRNGTHWRSDILCGKKLCPFYWQVGSEDGLDRKKTFLCEISVSKPDGRWRYREKKELSERATPHLPDFFLSFSKVAFLPLFTRKTKIEPRPAPKAGRRRGGKVTKSPIFFAGLGYACVIHAS